VNENFIKYYNNNNNNKKLGCHYKVLITNKKETTHHKQSNRTMGTHYTLMATVNQHPPVHDEGWMINGLKTVFYCISVPQLTMVVSSVSFFYYLPTNNPQAGC
jgi:hypothetical protein